MSNASGKKLQPKLANTRDYLLFVFIFELSLMSSQPSQKTAFGGPAEPKARGPNRTTKTVGKLKVLPEQAELATSPVPGAGESSAPPKDHDGGEDSEDEGDDEAEDEETDEHEVEVGPSAERIRM